MKYIFNKIIHWEELNDFVNKPVMFVTEAQFFNGTFKNIMTLLNTKQNAVFGKYVVSLNNNETKIDKIQITSTAKNIEQEFLVFDFTYARTLTEEEYKDYKKAVLKAKLLGVVKY